MHTLELELEQAPVVNKISREEFYREYVNQNKPVIIRGMTDEWRARDWNADYFRENDGGLKLAVKTGDVAQGQRQAMRMADYVTQLEAYEDSLKYGGDAKKPPYLHDVPIFNLLPNLVEDIKPFPIELFPSFYHENWQNYIQFFMGSTGSLTPLHFDTLCTHNLFFQVVGRKKFLLIPWAQKERCYRRGWRWARFDPNERDYEKYPEAEGVDIIEANLEPGDILYIPAGMLHQVHGLSYSISFNIDWHTSESARKGVMTMFHGAPLQNVYYNFLVFLGLGLKVPSKYIFPYYKSYLNYVS